MRKFILRATLALLVTFVVVGGVGLALSWYALGKGAGGERLERMQASPNWDDGSFENPLPLRNDMWGSAIGWTERSDYASPKSPISTVEPASFESPPDSGLRITWLGHSTVLIEIDGRTFLTDPVWGERASPLSFVGPARWYDPPLSLDELPRLDAVLISHDHYDHLDYPTITRMADMDTLFVTPLGVGAHLEYWGVPEDHIVELDWWDETVVDGLRIAATPARHASGRQVFDQNATLWAGFALIGPEHRVLFGGDTGLFPDFVDVGERYGPFDVTMIEVGAYHRYWPDWHIGPEQAIVAHQMLQGETFIPIHWGMFDLAMHGWTEPAERVRVAAEIVDVPVLFPRPGESLEPATATTQPWWPDVPWETAEQHPIISTGFDLDELGYELPVAR